MKNIMRSGGEREPIVATRRENSRRTSKRLNTRCSICRHHTWFEAIPLMEPAGAPEPRREWTLCKHCHQALLVEMRRSPVHSPLRLRIAMGLVAAERSPKAYGVRRTAMQDQTWIIVLAWGFGIAMILHLILIVMLAYVAGH